MPPRSGIDIIRFDVPGVGGSAHGGNSRARTDDVRRLFWANPLCSEPGFDTRKGRREMCRLPFLVSRPANYFSRSWVALAYTATSSPMTSALRRVSSLTQSTFTASASPIERSSCRLMACW